MESHESPLRESSLSPREALAQVAATNADVAERLITPWWYHPVLGLLLCLHLTLISTGSAPAIVVGTGLFAAGLGSLVSAYRRLTGIWVPSTTRPRGVRATAVFTALLMAALTVALLSAMTSVPWWVGGAAAAVLGVAIVPVGRWVDASMRADIRDAGLPAARQVRGARGGRR